MNKYVSVLKLGLFVTIVSVMSSAIDGFDGGIESPNVEVGKSAFAVMNALRSFGRLLSFQIDGIPPFINAMIAVPIALMVLFLILDVIKDIIPF